MPRGAVLLIARHPYDLLGPVVLSPQPSPTAGDVSELLCVPNATCHIGGDSGRPWVGCPILVGLRRLGRHGEVLFW